MNVDRQPHHQPENHDPPRPEHGQRRPQHHEQQEQRPQAELEGRAGQGLLIEGFGRSCPDACRRYQRTKPQSVLLGELRIDNRAA